MFSSVVEAVVLSVFCGLLYMVIWIDAAQFDTYKVEPLTCDINYGHVIATKQAKSAIHCNSNSKSICCLSSVFNEATGTCYINSRTKKSGDVVQGECGKDLKYSEKQAVFGQQCESDADCFEKNLTLCDNKTSLCGYCLNGMCACNHVRYHYNIIDQKCTRNCKNFDDSFEFLDKMHGDWRDATMRSNVSFEDCEGACLCEASFMCLYFSYNEESALCTYSWGFHGGSVDTGVFVDRYRRFCASP